MRTREVRLGLVLYGGVSLCIYENGIVQEIYRAICGEGLYKLIGQLIDSDIVVDVISGTSAGGVNGVMLAYALTNKADFLQTAARWRELGDIAELMRKPDDTDASSLLSSKYYQEELERCYAEALQPLSNPAAPEVGELDLFVTGTDAYGVISTVYDDLGHPIDVKNHRALFQLQYRGGRKNDFDQCDGNPVTPTQMATLSRLTSGFPVAFKPISIGGKEEDPNFYRWGRLDGPAIFMDGGILNNKPFTSTINAIASRTATREVERFLIYVEPRPEKFEKPKEAPLTPTIVEAGLWSLTSIPSYQSIAADLEAIEAHNERSLKVQKIVESLCDAPDTGSACLDHVRVVPADDDPCETRSYVTARLLLVKDAGVEAILNAPDGQRDFMTREVVKKRNPITGEEEDKVIDKRRSGRLLVQSFWQWEPDPANPYKTLVDYDIFFRKRRVDHLSNSLMGAIKREKDPIEVPLYTWEAVNHFFKLYEITQWAMITWLTRWKESRWEQLSEDHPDLDVLREVERNDILAAISKDIWGRAQERLDRLMTAKIDVPSFDGRSAVELVKARESYYKAFTVWIEDPIDGKEPNLLSRLDDELVRAIQALEGDGRTVETGLILRKEFCRFLDVDRQLLPVQIGSSFESTNVIRVVRFSPLDAQRGLSKGAVVDKVRGTALANFGAFFKKSWRAQDIRMGRLDAACLLTECLLTKERLTAMIVQHGPPKPSEVAKLVEQTLPNGGAALADTINDYFAGPTPQHWEKLIDAIVLAAHQQIEVEERPEVAKCALEQQYAWGQYEKEDCLPANLKFPSKWTSGKASPDEQLVSIAANAICQGNLGALPRFDPSFDKHKNFLDEVPVTAMQEHAALAWVRLGKSLLASVPAGRAHDAVEDSLIFRITMRWVPGYFYSLVHTRRTQPDWMLVPIAGFLNLALLGVLLLAWTSHWKQGLSMTYATLATAGVAAALLAEWALTRKGRWVAIGGMVVAILLTVAVGFAIGSPKSVPLWKDGHADLRLAGKCLVSFGVIVIYGTLRLRAVAAQIIFAAFAVAALYFVWR